MRYDIVEELVEVLHCGLCGGGLLHGEATKRGEHRDINGTCVIQEDSYDFLDERLVGFGEER